VACWISVVSAEEISLEGNLVISESPKLNKKKLKLKVGQKKKLKVTGTTKTVKWCSNFITAAVLQFQGCRTATRPCRMKAEVN